VRPFVHRVRRNAVGEPFRRLPGDRVVVVPVPGATQQTLLDRAFAQRAALVRAFVLQRAEPRPAAGERDAPPVDDDAADPPVRRYVVLVHPVPVARHVTPPTVATPTL